MTSREYDGLLMLCLSLALTALFFGITFILVFIYILYIAIMTDYKNINASHIVVLGKKLRNNSPDKNYLLRLDRVLAIASNDDNKQIYLLGGITGNANVSESKAGKFYLEDNNIHASNIHTEEKSRDTLENMKQLKTDNIISKKHIGLITNRYHLARASLMAKGFGFDIERCAAEDSFTPNLTTILISFAEAFYLHWYLSGLIYAKLTRNQRMLSRLQ